MQITQRAPLFNEIGRRQNRNYKELLHLLEIAPVGTWFAVDQNDVTGPSLYAKQSTLVVCCYRRFERGTVETHVEGENIFVRRIPMPPKITFAAAEDASLQPLPTAVQEVLNATSN